MLSLVWEDSLQRGMATHYSISAWRIPWMEEPGGLQSMGSQRVGRDSGYAHTLSSSIVQVLLHSQRLPGNCRAVGT